MYTSHLYDERDKHVGHSFLVFYPVVAVLLGTHVVIAHCPEVRRKVEKRGGRRKEEKRGGGRRKEEEKR